MLLPTTILALSSLILASPTRLVTKEPVYRALEQRQSADDYPAYTAYTIDQPIDHFPDNPRYAPHTNATFKQRYFFDSSYYQPGGPVYLYIGGETSGESRFSNLQTGIIQILMEATNGLGVILENRYYGESYPFNTSSTDELAYLTTEQTIADNDYFARHVTFPGIDASLNAPNTPWILYGGSLAGGQTAFSLKTYGNVSLYGGIASSGVIHAVTAYDQWYDPYQKWGPSDGVASINAIIDKFDGLVAAKDTAAIQHFKSLFGLEALTDNRDFAMTIAFPLGGPMNYPTETWQELNWYPAYDHEDIFQFFSNVTNLDAPENITAVDYALANYTNGEPWTNLGNYANYVKQVIVPLCESGDINNSQCFGTQNGSSLLPKDEQEANLLTKKPFMRTSPIRRPVPTSIPRARNKALTKLRSRPVLHLSPESYNQQWCTWAFPDGVYNSIPPTPDLSYYNNYGDLNFSADRLAFIDGNQDVWNDLCYHSTNASRRYSSDLHPEYLIADGGHHWDSYGIRNVLKLKTIDIAGWRVDTGHQGHALKSRDGTNGGDGGEPGLRADGQVPSMPPKTPPVVSFISGGVAGAVEAACTYPFEFAKTRAQLFASSASHSPPPKNPYSIILQVARADGFRALYAGCAALVVGSVLKDSIRFLSFDMIKSAFADAETGTMTPLRNLGAGMTTGVVASLCAVTPSERIKTALVDDAREGGKRYRGSVMHAVAVVWRDGGVRGMYRGLEGTTLKQASATACRMGSYNILKDWEWKRGIEQGTAVNFANGAVAGTLTTYATQPFDVVKTRSQSAKGASAMEAARSIWAEAGVGGFWRGTVMRLSRTVVSGGILFTVYERVAGVLRTVVKE
ncbi:MAG: hypothetical protein Q9190_000151 [Brigantiaea leucoxantha]